MPPPLTPEVRFEIDRAFEHYMPRLRALGFDWADYLDPAETEPDPMEKHAFKQKVATPEFLWLDSAGAQIGQMNNLGKLTLANGLVISAGDVTVAGDVITDDVKVKTSGASFRVLDFGGTAMITASPLAGITFRQLGTTNLIGSFRDTSNSLRWAVRSKDGTGGDGVFDRIDATGPGEFRTPLADGASAVAWRFGTSANWTIPGSKLFSIGTNLGVSYAEKVSFHNAGQIAVGTGFTPTNSYVHVRQTGLAYLEVESTTTGAVNEGGLRLRRSEVGPSPLGGYAQVLYHTGGSGSTGLAWALGLRAGTTDFVLFDATTGLGALRVTAAPNNWAFGTSTPSARLHVQVNSQPATVKLMLDADTAQTADVFQTRTSAGSVTASIDPTGRGAFNGGVLIGSTNAEAITFSAVETATLDFGSIAAGFYEDLTITVTGAAVGDQVAVGPPAALEGNLAVFGHVSAADTVTVRALNNNLVGAIDPASASYTVRVFR